MRRLRCHVLPLIFVAWFTFCYLVGGDGVFFALMASYPTILVETLPFGVVTVCWSSEVPHEDIIGLHRTNKPRPSHGTRACTPPKGLLAHPSQQQLFLIPPSISHPPSLPLHGEGESVGTDNLYNPFPNATRWPSLQSFSSSDSTWRSVATPYETLAYSTLPISTDSKYCNRRHASNASGALNIPRWASITVPSLLALNKTPDPCLWKLQMSLLSTRLPPFGIPLSSNCLNPQLGLQSVNTNLACTSANIRICSIAFDIIAGPFLLRLLWDNSVFGPAACISGGG